MGIFKKPPFNSDKKRDFPEGLWQKCPSCGEMIHNLELVQNFRVCPKCDHHFTQSARERLEMLLDPDSFEEHDANMISVDTLKFTGMASYTERLKSYQKKTGLKDAVVVPTPTDQDQIAVRELQTLGGPPMTIPVNGNLSFAQGAVEQMAGDSNLITVRSRASRERPFTVVQKMQADAESNYRSKIKELETSLSDTQRKVNDLQRSKDAGQKFILSTEQQQELTNFRKTEADVKTQLKDMRRKLRSEIDSLENRIKWINIAAMPIVVILAGFVFALMKRRTVRA